MKDFRMLFETLVEIQGLLYSHEDQRTVKSILRLYNLTFVHGMEARRLFKKPKALTKRKMFGQYFHALICHAPQQFRVVALMSTNAENEEREFNFLKNVSTHTSNHHPENVLTNAFVRTQVKFLKITTIILTFYFYL